MVDVAALFVANLFSQFFRSFLAVLSPALQAELGVEPSQLADAAGAWFLAFALAQIPVGMALDRLGPGKVTGALMIFGCGGGALAFATAETGGRLIAAMALIGLGCSPVLMAGIVTFARRFAPARFATLTGALIGFGSLGNVLGAAPLARAAALFGWRDVMLGMAVAAVATGVMMLAVMRDPAPAKVEGDSPMRGLIEVLRIRPLRFLIPLAVFNYAVSAGIRGAWAGPYLSEVHGLSAVMIGDATLWMALAMTAGNFLCGPISARAGTVKWVIFPLNAAGALCALALAVLSPGAGAATAILVVLGFCGATYALLTSHARSFVPLHLTGRGATVVNFFGMGGVGLGQLVTGRIHDFAAAGWDDPSFAYAAVFAYYGLALLMALSIYAFSRDAPPTRG